MPEEEVARKRIWVMQTRRKDARARERERERVQYVALQTLNPKPKNSLRNLLVF
jgi:hypothetical protein